MDKRAFDGATNSHIQLAQAREGAVENNQAQPDWAQLLRDPAAKISILDSGELQLQTPDGATLEIPGTAPLVRAFNAAPDALIRFLSDNPDTLLAWIQNGDNADGYLAIVEKIQNEIGGSSQTDPQASGFSNDGRAVSPDPMSQVNSDPLSLGPQPRSGSLVEDQITSRFGRDDLKRGEVGSAGEVPVVGTGAALGHLTGLPDEELGLRNGEKVYSSENFRFTGETTGVGQSIDHLWLLGDMEYYRASGDELTVDEILPDFDRSAPVYPPLIKAPLVFNAVEDTNLNDELFSAAEAILPVNDIVLTMDPAVGTIVAQPDGTLVYTPAPGFSGQTEFDYQLTDPRNGEFISGTATVIVEAVADPAAISGTATTPEDTLVAAPVTVTLGDTDGSETICYAEITDVPVGATLGFSGATSSTITPLAGGGLRFEGDTADIQADLLLLTFDPPLHFSGQVTLDVEVKTIESNADPLVPGFNDTETVNHPYVINVIPVADAPPTVGGNFVTDEDTRVALTGINSTIVDNDGSEVHTITISGVDANARLENAAGAEFPVTIEADGTRTYTIDPTLVGGVFYNPPPNEHGTFNMTITGTTTEQANGDQASNVAPIQVVINPVNDLPIPTGASSTDEDTQVGFGGNITIPPIVDPDGSESITRVEISGVPAGANVNGTAQGGATLNVVGGVITVTGPNEQSIRDTVATLALTPPLHTDDEIDLQIVIETTDAGVVAVTPPTTHTITVAAIADAPNLAASAAGTEDNPIDLVITTSLVDTDGSETYDFAEVTMPAGINLILPAILPNGIQVAKVGDVYTFTPGTATTAQFENFLANDIQIDPPLDSDVDFDVTIRVGTIESAPVGGQVTTLRNESSTTTTVVVTPVVDTPAINTVSSVNEDAIVDPSQPQAPGNITPHGFGAIVEGGITLGETAPGDTSEEITQIVVSGIPATATIGSTPVAGANIDTGTPGQVTITGTSETVIRDALKTLTIVPGSHEDADISLGVAVTVRDNDPDNAAASVTQTFNGTHGITVSAVADAPTLAASASGTEDNPIDFPITVGLTDTDGSETYDFAEITMPAGINLILPGALPNGIQMAKVGDVYTFTPGTATTAQFENFLANDIQIDPPLDSDVDFDVTVRVGTIESNLTDGQVVRLRNESSTTVTVEVLPVVDTPAINSNSSVNEDAIADPAQPQAAGNITPHGFGTPLEAAIVLGETAPGDTSEEITQVVITGIPASATLNSTPVVGANIDTATPGQVTITGTNETVIRDAIKTLTIVPGSHEDADISLGVAVTVRDNDPDNAASSTSQTFNGTHAIAVAAVADPPTLSASASGTEDNPIDFPITVGLNDTDGSETYDFAEVTMPAGINLILPGALPNGIQVTKVGDVYTFTPGTATTAQFENFLANDIQIDPPLDSDVDFDVTVRVGTIESNLTDGQVARLRNESSTTVTVEVLPVVDTPTINTASTMNEDAIVDTNLPQAPGNVSPHGFGAIAEAGISLGETAPGDTSEEITQIVITGMPGSATIGSTPVAGANIDTALLPGQVTITGTDETVIRDALKTLTIVPGLHDGRRLLRWVSR